MNFPGIVKIGLAIAKISKMDVEDINNTPKKKSKVDAYEQNMPTPKKVSKSNGAAQKPTVLVDYNSSKSKEKSSSSPVKIQNCLKFDNENIGLPIIGISPRRKRKFDICEKNTPSAKKVMPSFSNSNKESSLVKPGNNLGLKFDRQNVTAASALLATCVSDCKKILKLTVPEGLQRTPEKQGVVKVTTVFFSV